MRKKKIACLLGALVLLLASCGQNSEVSVESPSPESSVPSVESSVPSDIPEPESSLPETPESSAASSEAEKEQADSSKPSSASETESNVGGGSFCLAHKFLYHSYSSQLIGYVGEENFDAWGESMKGKPAEDSNIVSFVEYFQIPKETLIEVERVNYTPDFAEYDGVFMLSLEQIDAIYSGDKRLINETFCGPLAFVNDADGELYSVYWLAEHTAEDYIAAKLPLDRVAVILEDAALPDNGKRYDLIEKIEPQLERARELEKAAAAK